MSEFWDQRYSDEVYLYGEKPNAFLEHRHTLIPRDARVLVLADGEGRNGVFLARRRMKVTSVEASAKGVEKAKALAKKQGAELTVIHGELPDVDIEMGVWDAVVLIFLHLPEEERKAVHQFAVDALKPGGLLILEAFTPDQLGNASGGPKEASRLYTADMLKEDFKDLQIDGLVELETVLDEGPGHQGKANVVRVIAAKGD